MPFEACPKVTHRQGSMPTKYKLKSDLGTIVIHWVMVVNLIGAAVTGITIACIDNPDFLIVHYFGFVLPGENVWYFHLFFSVGVSASIAAYVVYIKRARLAGRIAIDA